MGDGILTDDQLRESDLRVAQMTMLCAAELLIVLQLLQQRCRSRVIPWQQELKWDASVASPPAGVKFFVELKRDGLWISREATCMISDPEGEPMRIHASWRLQYRGDRWFFQERMPEGYVEGPWHDYSVACRGIIAGPFETIYRRDDAFRMILWLFDGFM